MREMARRGKHFVDVRTAGIPAMRQTGKAGSHAKDLPLLDIVTQYNMISMKPMAASGRISRGKGERRWLWGGGERGTVPMEECSLGIHNPSSSSWSWFRS
jgi:hypothetical protein